MAKKKNGCELLRQDNETLRKQFVDCRKLLEEERGKNEVLTANKDGAISLLDESIETSKSLADKVLRYEKALKFYANEDNYVSPIFDEHGQFDGSLADRDCGEIAMKALGYTE